MGQNATAVRTHVVVGHPVHVGAALRRAAMDGRLAGLRDPVELPGRRVQVTADLREPVQSRGTFATEQARRRLRPVLMRLLVAAVAGGAIWAMVLLVSALLAAADGSRLVAGRTCSR